MRTLPWVAALLLFAPVIASANSDIHFSPDGKVTATNLVVIQKNDGNLFCRATWGEAFIRLVVLANTSTTITRAHGEAGTVADIQEKDVIDVDGQLAVGADSLIIGAKTIRDSALQSAGKTLSGTVKSVDPGSNSFVLFNKLFGSTTVHLRDGSAITKGARAISLSQLAAADSVLSADGIYDYSSNTLSVSSVSVYQDKTIFMPRNFEGALKSIDSRDLPTSATVTVGAQDYTVYLNKDATILNNAKAKVTLARFVIGDKVRFHGAIRQTDLSQVDADTLRDLNF